MCRHSEDQGILFVPEGLSTDSISIGSIYHKMLNWEIIHKEPKELQILATFYIERYDKQIDYK